MECCELPKKRSSLRLRAGKLYYGTLRRLLWHKMRGLIASARQEEPLPYLWFSHKTILLRRLKNVDMWMQENKKVNLRIAASHLNGILIRPGEVFSFWKLVGRPAGRKGYLPGMVLINGRLESGTGGGLCQMSNLIFWMALHSPLSVIERHRHGHDVFPDSNRTQPFGSGATCFYPYGDLMIGNNTPDTYQLLVRVGEEYLEGELRASAKPRERFEIVERNHEFRGEYWGGFTRHNKLYQQRFGPDGTLLGETLVVENSAITMYSPYIAQESVL